MRWLLLLLIASPASAATFFVEAGGDSPWQDIQPAIEAARDGDRILVAPGIYGPIDFGGKGIEVRAVTPVQGVTTIDAGGSGAAVTFGEQAPPEALLHGFNITGGVAALEESVGIEAGGGLLVTRGSRPRISHNWITGNEAASGAAVAIINAAPQLYGNVLSLNTATAGAGGIWIHNPDESNEVLLACNDLLENSGGAVGGLLIDDAQVAIHNNAFNSNSGERGAIYATAGVTGLLANNTLVSNGSWLGGVAGIESAADGLEVTSNIIAYGSGGWGVVRSTTVASWTWNLLWDNDAGDWSGLAGLPDVADGNLSAMPDFTVFTLAGGLDDVLLLLPTSPLLDEGNPAPALDDLDGSRNAVGLDGGQREGCDGDGDGVREDEGDCRTDDPDFHPGAHEVVPGLDSDCSGMALHDERTFVDDDGDAVATGNFVLDPPLFLPGYGYQSEDAWCTGCDSGDAEGGLLTFSFDLTGLAGEAQLELVHAYDATGDEDGVVALWSSGAALEPIEPDAGYPSAPSTGTLASESTLGRWAGTVDRWVVDTFDVGAAAGGAFDFVVHHEGEDQLAGGASVGRIALYIEDADDDQRAGALDCDDSDSTIYDGAPEVPYDGIDQDCDGADLLDVDGDGFEGGASGDDCDDEDPLANPDGVEVPYDAIDQDCDGVDLVDVDGDGAIAEEAGGDDCDDDDDAIGPAAAEIAYDGIDQDCDGEDLLDVDGDGVNVDEDCDDEEPLAWPGNLDFCDDGIDNDCDGVVDRQGDGDGDGVDVCEGDCDDTDAAVGPDVDEACDGIDTDCDGAIGTEEFDVDEDGVLVCAGDCDDADPLRALGLTEVCDGVDNDCDRGVDEGLDRDGDGFSGCTLDCDDQRSSIYPGADEVCDSNLDHDCDGVRDFEQEECVNPEATGCAVGGSGGWLLVFLVLGRRRAQGGRPTPTDP